jgi:hypothetical protein
MTVSSPALEMFCPAHGADSVRFAAPIIDRI